MLPSMYGRVAIVRRGILVAVALVAITLAGSTIYWLADGRTGTPGEFRERVSAAGLDVAWMNSGPRGGSGSVETDCGPVAVEIDEIDGELWVQWADSREVATAEVVDAILACE